jgi:hypothetical protein
LSPFSLSAGRQYSTAGLLRSSHETCHCLDVNIKS